ncbi:MAG: N-6 DNA methylase [Ignavibacteriales bacterium]|nr:N-6 DNA methylase [Ignavibacteriales bacterium]
MLETYIKKIASSTAQGDAREESYYGNFSNFLESFAAETGKKHIQITTLPKKTEAGNPDFRVWDGKQQIVGYIEAKKPGENLDLIEDSEQLKRYRATFPNLILTDFYEFRLYRNGDLFDKVLLARPYIAKKLKTVPPVEHKEKFITLLEKFFSFSLPNVLTAENLAVELAKRTGFLRDEVVIKELEEAEHGKGKTFGFYTAFKQYLVSDLSPKDFADIYSQTITYGLFAARTRATGEFNRKLAYDLIPKTIGILRDVFRFISLDKLPPQMEVIIDDIAEVLQAADVNKILDEYYRKGKGEDPIVHFYETLLNIYDPGTREKRGVYYTPEPVVKYIVRAIHDLLKTHFHLQDGLASKDVTLLDPAGGTLTFPAEAIKLAVQEYITKYGDAGKTKLIKNQILKNFYAFELMMAPYAIGHIKISFLLEELGYTMQDDDRFKLYLTNTLDIEDLKQTEIPGLESLSDENHLAGQIKQKEPILVILGNPPYSANSANSNDWTEQLLKEDIDGATGYYTVDGQPLGEKNPKWLQDDYVKFLRFAQWKIHKAGQGIVGMITNHSYLDNPTFRGMRQSLVKTYNEIYIIDLHGNAKKKETTPDGEKDENVFDIQQGTAIAVFVKTKNTKGCKVYHRDIFGLRDEKYEWLEKKPFKKKDYETLNPKTPWYFLIKRNTEEIEHYEKWWKVNDVFPTHNVGIVTAKDDFAIAFNKEALEGRIRQFRNMKFDKEFLASAYHLKSSGSWDLDEAREKLAKDEDYDEHYNKILYRPFDERFIYYSEFIVERMRYDVMQHMLKENIGICFMRPQSPKFDVSPFVSDTFIDQCVVGNKTAGGGISYIAPLYLYETEKAKKKASLSTMMLFETAAEYGKAKSQGDRGKKANIALKVFEQLGETYGKVPTPEQILQYCYAVLYSNVYREKYAEFLKIDFPRIPFTKNYELFHEMSKLGSELIELHLLKHKALNKPILKYFGKGKDDAIVKPRYDKENERVYINDQKYFENVSAEVWNYQIGGYQVMEKYLKDRKGRQMEDSGHYCQMGTSIARTIEVQKELDKLFPRVEKKVIEL